MNVTFESIGSATVIDLFGRLDSANAATVEAELLARLAAEAGGVVIDFTRLDYISSAGLRIVLVIAKRMKQGSRRLVLTGFQPNIKDVFEISGFLNILDVASSRADAVKQAGSG